MVGGCVYCFCFNVTAHAEIYTYRHALSLHDALPILSAWIGFRNLTLVSWVGAKPPSASMVTAARPMAESRTVITQPPWTMPPGLRKRSSGVAISSMQIGRAHV